MRTANIVVIAFFESLIPTSPKPYVCDDILNYTPLIWPLYQFLNILSNHIPRLINCFSKIAIAKKPPMEYDTTTMEMVLNVKEIYTYETALCRNRKLYQEEYTCRDIEENLGFPRNR